MLNTKLELTDSLQDVITKLSEGNPGAINFLFEIIKHQGNNPIESFGEFLTIDSMHLYGSHLYMLWNDCCNRDVEKSLKIIKGYRLGNIKDNDIKDNDIKERIINVGYGMSFDDLLERGNI